MKLLVNLCFIHPTLAASLPQQPHLPDGDALVDRLAHVVDGEGGHRRTHHRLHLHAGLARAACLALNLKKESEVVIPRVCRNSTGAATRPGSNALILHTTAYRHGTTRKS